MKKPSVICMTTAFLAFASLTVDAAPEPDHETWTDPEFALREDPDFAIQGEYRSADVEAAMGTQVVALGNGRFEVYILDGGLRGAGWEPGKSRILLKGERKDGGIECKDEAAKITATIDNGSLSLTNLDGAKHHLARLERKSPTLGAKPPEGAAVLFDGTSAEQPPFPRPPVRSNGSFRGLPQKGNSLQC